jgi:hypothetical protein
MLRKPLVTSGISLADGMLSAIALDNQPLLATSKIDNVFSGRLLAEQFVAADLR